jgi:hypothetical protein
MGHPTQTRRRSVRHLALFLCAVASLLCAAGGAHAASIYRCVAANGRIAFRDTPCATHARQTKMSLAGLPLIDPGAPRHRPARRSRAPSKRSLSRHRHARVHRQTGPTSWECRAADGEVFYRHTRCPGSVPGDGVVRIRYAETFRASHPRKRRNAWSRVPVHGVRIPRAEACRRIRSAGAAIRDGHRRDAHVSTYDRLMGRGPCAGT